MQLELLLLIIATCLATSSLAGNIGFVTVPSDQAIVFGQDVFLHCSAVNTSTGSRDGLSTQWWFNDGPRSQTTSIFTNGTLLIPKVAAEDLGNYTCVIFDDMEVATSPQAMVFHAYIKMFEVSPTDVFAIEGTLVSFDCITGESAPPPVIFWERNDKPFDGGEQYSATYGGYAANSLIKQYSMRLILRATPSLDGNYKCVARNPVLQIDVSSMEVFLRTAELDTPPYIVEELVINRMVTPYNQSMLLDCPITGKPQVDVTWYKNGNQSLIDGDPDFLVLQNGSLHNPSSRLEDTGTYHCDGQNNLGYVESGNISVVVAQINMTFLESPQDLYTIAGLPAILKCSPPSSVPVANVTWYKDNSLLVPRAGPQSVRVVTTYDGHWNLHFAEIQKQDEGEYFCVGTNRFAVPQSRTSTIARIRVGGAPIFVQPPTGLTIEKGKLAKMTCYVQGDPFPEVTWLFEDEELEAGQTLSFRQGQQELWIGDIHKGHEGTYTCRAVNRYGAIETRVYVKVLVPPVILEPVGHRTVSVGDTVIIPCQLYSDPSPTVTWYKDLATIVMGGRFTQLQDSLYITSVQQQDAGNYLCRASNLLLDLAAIVMGGRFTQLQDGLYITSVQQQDTGSYLCRASNMAGTVESEGTLDIQVLPHFVTKPKNQVVTLGNNATLTCVGAGYPTVNITWLFNGTSMFPQDTLLSLDKKQLFLLEVKWLHVGEYSCRVANVEGSAIATATVTVQIPPRVESIQGVPLLYQGEDLLLKCRLTGTPAPSVEWQFNRQPVQESMDGRVTLPNPKTLSIKFITLNEAGVYTCKGTNRAGVSQRDIDVFVLNKPSAPVLYRAETQSATSVTLSWSTAQEQPQTPVTSLTIYFRKKLESSSQLSNIKVDATYQQYEIYGLHPASDYIFMVAAVNDAGTSEVSNILSARTFDAGPSSPRNLEVTQTHAHNLTLRWEIPAVTNGQMKKYRLKYGEKGTGQDHAVELMANGSASQSHMITGLQPYSWYTVQVQGATMEGDQVLWGNWSQTTSVKTGQAGPTGSPNEVLARPLSPNMIMVSWEAVLQSQQNGPIKRYHIQYWLLGNSSHHLGELVSESLDHKVNISDLDPWTYYVVQVYSENEGGLGPPSVEVLVRTMPAAPSSEPLNVSTTAITDSSIFISWLPPLESDWNSDLSGYIIHYWEEAVGNGTQVVSLDLEVTTYIISDLDPWTMYELQIAAFTDQVLNGSGPFSENVSVRTLQSEPGPVDDLTFVATSTTLKLSWKPPTIKNGIVMEYIIEYQLIGPVLEAPPTENDQPIISDFVADIFNDTAIMINIFHDYQSEMTLDSLQSLTEMCDIILTNYSLQEDVSNATDFSQSESLLQDFNVTDELIGWMGSSNTSVLNFCKYLESSARQIIDRLGEAETVYPVLNVTRTGTSVVLTSLQPEHVYNVSVSAATEAGYGQPSNILSTTLKAGVIPATTRRPPPVTRRPTTQTPVLAEQKGDDSDRQLPYIIAGGVAGLILILLILVIMICGFIRRRRFNSEEKAQVIQQDSNEDVDKYGELDRPRYPNTASAAEDGTDTDSRLSGNVNMYPGNVKYQKNPKSTVNSFMTSESGAPLAASNGRRIKEAFLGIDDTSYGAQGTVKSNPAYFEEPSSSDLESMSVSMALSSEDVYSQGESTLKRKSKMRSVDAAAIARLRSSTLPRGMMSSDDTSNLINNEVEVVLNERTAL